MMLRYNLYAIRVVERSVVPNERNIALNTNTLFDSAGWTYSLGPTIIDVDEKAEYINFGYKIYQF